MFVVVSTVLAAAADAQTTGTQQPHSATAGTGQVIAAGPDADQPSAVAVAPTPAPAGETGGSIGSDLLIFAMAVAALALFIRRRWYRLPAVPDRTAPFTPMIGFALYLALWLASMIGASVAWIMVRTNPDVLLHAANPSFEQSIRIMLGAYAAQALVGLVYGWMVIRAPRESQDRRPGAVFATLIGAAALLLIWPVSQSMTTAAVYVRQLFVEQLPPPIAHETLQAMVDRTVDGPFIAMAALVIVGAPILEEVMYRGVLQESLRRLGIGPWPAILGTSAIFALLHAAVVPWHALVGLAVLAVGFGWIYEKTGRLTASIAMHMLFNAGNLAIAMALM